MRVWLKILVALALAAAKPCAATEHSTDPMDWLIQHVCADAADKPIPTDPYGGCPAGTHERRLALGEDLPYYRHDQPGPNGNHPFGFQRHDAYPLIDRHYGGVISVNAYDFDIVGPYGNFSPSSGDGFDIFRVAGGYATGGGTRDGGGFSSTFFGADCKPWDGWTFFPVHFLKELAPGASGRVASPIHGVYWEQNGEAWPGKCEIGGKGFSATTLSVWSFEPNHLFSGFRGTKPKRIDAIVSTHGLPDPPGSHKVFHMERFYFTDLYGPTRWETWVPASENPPPQMTCGGDTEMTFGGIDFVLLSCRDWSVVEPLRPPQPAPPWPIPESNVLSNWHFTNDSLAPWRLEGENATNPAVQTALLNSTTAVDIRHSQNKAGVRYLSINCVAAETGCGVTLFQDLDRDKIPPVRRMDFGFSGVMGDLSEGEVEVALLQTDASGKELWSRRTTARLGHANRGNGNRIFTPDISIFRASSTLLEPVKGFRWEEGATKLRLELKLKSPGLYDLLDTWVMPL